MITRIPLPFLPFFSRVQVATPSAYGPLGANDGKSCTRLDGKRIVVAGASTEVGRYLAATLCDAGAEVALADRSLRDVEETAEGLCRAGYQAFPMVLDASDPDNARRAIGEAEPFHVLVNGPGVSRPSPFRKLTIDDFQAVAASNLTEPFFFIQMFIDRALASGAALSVINVSSISGSLGASHDAVHSASRYGIEGLGKSLAADLAPKGIRVNSICLTGFDVTSKSSASEGLKGPLLLLAGDEGALITATTIRVDGRLDRSPNHDSEAAHALTTIQASQS